MVSEDASTVVVAGEQYHYIFRKQQQLAELLTWEHKDALTFRLDEKFYLSPDNTITGKYTVTCNCKSADPGMIKWLRQKAFIPVPESASYYRTDNISGKLYLANNIDLSAYRANKKQYRVTVISQRPFNSLAKIAFTPVTLAIDSIHAAIYGSALSIASPFILTDNAHNE